MERTPRAWMLALLVAVAPCAAGCDEPEPTGPDADGDADGDADADADADEDADEDADDGGSDGEPGPLTYVASSFAFVLDRLCDLDDDGSLDNSFADLGSPAGDVLIMAFNSSMTGTGDDDARVVVHLPWVDDATAPTSSEGVLIVYRGVDTDEPVDPGDDFSGEEPFYVDPQSLDPCGEPTAHTSGVEIDAGDLEAARGMLVIELNGFAPLYTPEVHGQLDRGGEGGTITTCSYATIADLGAEEGGDDPAGLSSLETLLAGGAALGFPSLPGLAPDVDVDGDGLERFLLDTEGHIVSCIDADTTVIDGRDCWQDPRMADAFSIIISYELVGARFAGRLPGWEEEVEGTCVEPPERSLWDPP